VELEEGKQVFLLQTAQNDLQVIRSKPRKIKIPREFVMSFYISEASIMAQEL
jgi:hypothetical protein